LSSNKTKAQGIPKAVLLLGIASFLTDIAGDAIYSLLPIFLTSLVGATPFFIGILEGMAESVASVTKFFSGYFSDRTGKQKPWVIFGYGLSGLVRPLMGLVVTPAQALFVRFGDRIGKGIRSSPRDAWLASIAEPSQRGRIFGFHRAMDNAGATVGPLLATAFLLWRPGDYRNLFLSTGVFSVIAFVFILLAVKERGTPAEGAAALKAAKPKIRGAATGKLPRHFHTYLAILLIFTLGNSSDAFLLLRLKGVGVQDAWIPTLWAGLQLVKTIFSGIGGRFSDAYGRKPAIILGWILYAAIYLAIGNIPSMNIVIGLFLFYGVFYGFTESPEKALVADLVPESKRGTAFGLYNLVLGIGALPASLLFGFVWQAYGVSAAFTMGAGLAGLASVMLLGLNLKPPLSPRI
jgi:MFS family permease